MLDIDLQQYCGKTSSIFNAYETKSFPWIAKISYVNFFFLENTENQVGNYQKYLPLKNYLNSC